LYHPQLVFQTIPMKRILVPLTLALATALTPANAAISIGPGGSGVLTFDAVPAVTEWSTLTVGTSAGTITTIAGLGAAVQPLTAATIVTPLGTSATVPPSPNSIARWNSTRMNLQTRPTGNDFTVLMATLQNDTGTDVSALTVVYNLGLEVAVGSTAVEDIPGHRAYFSLTGDIDSWQPIPEFSTGTPGSLLAILNLGSWPAGSLLYLLWADDNGPASGTAPNEEGAYTIDDFSVTVGGSGVTITSPANGQIFAVDTTIPITATATMQGTVVNIAFRANGALIGNDTTAPFGIDYNNAPIGTNELTATATDNLGNTVTSAPVYVVVRPNQAPTVTLANPAAGDILIVNNVTLNATATDVDGTVAQVQFYEGGTVWGTDTTAPYGAIRTSVPAGVHTITAVAIDDKGLSSTSAPVTFTVVAPLPSLVPFGATWKYNDTGTDLGTDWTLLAYDDSSWSSGPAELGYGDNDEATLVNGGPTDNRIITTYFRHRFTVPNAASVTSLALKVRRDDGVIVYLNGQPIFSDNMTNELFQVNFQTLALDAVEDTDIVATNIDLSLFPGLLAFDNVLAVEIHQATITSSDISFDLQLIANPGTHAPVVNLTAPTNGVSFITPVDIPMTATAYDLDGSVTVAFFLDDQQVGTTDATQVFGRTATDVQPGTHVLRAVATDNTGLTSSSEVTVVVIAGPVSVVLVQTNTVWKFLDDGSDQGTGWSQSGFDDSLWSSGPAELGYGDGDEATVLSFGGDDLNKHITYYFRQTFTATGSGDYTNLVVNLRRDDGAVVYLNGFEVFRSNMPEGPIDFQTLAGGAIGSETAFFSTNVSPGLLLEGENLLAVEVHQVSVDSSDISFELRLIGTKPPGPSRPRLSIVRTATGVTLSWGSEVGYRLEQAPTVTGPWTTSPNQSNPQNVTIAPGSGNLFYRLVNP
jgi:hypothetical protein